MPRLVRLYIISVLIGFGLAAVFTGLLVWVDVANLRHLLGTPGGWLAAFMLVFFFTILFGGVQFAVAIMRLAESEGQGGGMKLRLWKRTARAVPVRSARKT